MSLPSNIVNEIKMLAERVRNGDIRQIDIATATGVDQSQVSRILAGNIKRLSKNVQKVCNYAKTVAPQSSCQTNRSHSLTDKLLSIWDGSENHASALQELLAAVEHIQNASRNSRRD